MISVIYIGISMLTILVALSTAVASYKNATNYVLIHTGLTGIFLPVSILVYFSTVAYRYKVTDYTEDYGQMIIDFRVSGTHKKDPLHHQDQSDATSPRTIVDGSTSNKSTLNSFINLIDLLQTKFSCCGIDSLHDWTSTWSDYIPASCCKNTLVATNEKWAQLFHTPSDHEFKYCSDKEAYPLSCIIALKEDELSKYAWLGDLIVFMIVITIGNTIVSLLLFGLTKTEDNSYEGGDNELSIVGVSSKPRLSQPTIMSIKHRPSLVHTLGASKEVLSNRAQAVRFNITTSPRVSISGPSKFSPAARRGSSFL